MTSFSILGLIFFITSVCSIFLISGICIYKVLTTKNKEK